MAFLRHIVRKLIFYPAMLLPLFYRTSKTDAKEPGKPASIQDYCSAFGADEEYDVPPHTLFCAYLAQRYASVAVNIIWGDSSNCSHIVWEALSSLEKRYCKPHM